MLPYPELFNNLGLVEYETVKTNKRIEYINLPCGFDIETTSTKEGDKKIAFMYIWMVAIGHGNGVFYGRTWEEFSEVCEVLQAKFQLNQSRRLVIYVHNLGYEFQFMRKYFKWMEVFAVSERKPIKAVTEHGIEFRDSYILSGFSLANTAKNLTKYKIKKLEGDLDYSLIRHHETPLTVEEMTYCENDVAIITAYISEQIELYKDITKIPTTNTGRVRKHVRNECYYSDTNHRKSSKSKYIRYRKIMQDLTIDPETYIQLKRSFMGGFTHANANYSWQTLEEISSIDFTSSYPAVMVSEKFPMSRFKPMDIESEEHLKESCSKFAMVFDIKFYGLRAKIEQDNYISESKCYQTEKATINNGRIHSAEMIATTLTEIDFEIMMQSYEWDSIDVANVKFAHKNYLPKSIIKSILDLYQDKTVLKDVEGSEVEYLLSKGMLNSIYGMCVTDIVKDNSIYDEDWGVERVDIEAEIEKYNNSKNRFLYYAWGIWVTAYARRNLWTGIVAVGNDYVYSDTDSLKIKNYEKHKEYVSWYDKQVMQKMLAMCEYYKFDPALLTPKTKDGKVKPLGIWDFEGTYTRFKTLGAKRYLTEHNGKLQITVAGLSKQNGLEYLKEQADNDHAKVFENFTHEMYVPPERTGKMTHTYIDDEIAHYCTDYKGHAIWVNPLTGVHLESCDFTLSVARQYQEFLRNLSQGYIYNGVKHQ